MWLEEFLTQSKTLINTSCCCYCHHHYHYYYYSIQHQPYTRPCGPLLPLLSLPRDPWLLLETELQGFSQKLSLSTPVPTSRFWTALSPGQGILEGEKYNKLCGCDHTLKFIFSPNQPTTIYFTESSNSCHMHSVAVFSRKDRWHMIVSLEPFNTG